MTKDFNPENVDAVLGGVNDITGEKIYRTPLHVDFAADTHWVHGEYIYGEQLLYPEVFNAVGSISFDANGFLLGHLPLVDADGGAKVQNYGNISKAILKAHYWASYLPSSLLRDVLGDHGIDLEVFETPVAYSQRGAGNAVTNYVKALVLRSKEVVFEAVDSTNPDHGHLYIQKLFTPLDHDTLMEELRGTGIISSDWFDIFKQEGMGVVRTPWSKKDPSHSDTD